MAKKKTNEKEQVKQAWTASDYLENRKKRVEGAKSYSAPKGETAGQISTRNIVQNAGEGYSYKRPGLTVSRDLVERVAGANTQAERTREQVRTATNPVQSAALDEYLKRNQSRASQSAQAITGADLSTNRMRKPSLFRDYMAPLAERQKEQQKQTNPLSSFQTVKPKVQHMIGNVDINDRPIVELGNGEYATTETTFQERWKGDEENGHYEIGHFATITKDGRKISDEEMNEYIDRVMSSDNPFETDKKGLNLLYKIDDKLTNGEYIRDNNLEQAFKEADDWDVEMHNLQDSMYRDQREKNNLSSVSRDLATNPVQSAALDEYKRRNYTPTNNQRSMTVPRNLVNRVAQNADNGVAQITRDYAQRGSAPKDTSFMTDNLAAREASRRNEQRDMAAEGQAVAKRYDKARRAEMYQRRYEEDLHKKDEKGNIEAYKYMYDAKLPDETGIPFEVFGQKGTVQPPRIVEQFTDPELNRVKSLPYNMMTEDEKDVYRYTLGKYGQAAATDYLETLEESLNQRLNDRNFALNEYIARKNPVLGAATNVLTSYPASIMGYGATLKNALSEDKISPNDPLLRATVLQEATQSGTQKGVRDMIGAEDDTMKAAVSDFLVGTGLSALNSVAQVHTLPEPLVLASFSGSAMGSSVRKTSQDPNSTKGQTTATAVAFGIAESFFERFSIENLKAMRTMPPTSVKGILKAFLKQGVTEGSEEVATEAANILSDIVINGDNSEAGQRFKKNIESGMDYSSALANTLSSLSQDVALAGLGGFISGGITSGAEIAIGTYQGGRQLKGDVSKYNGDSNYYQEIADSIDTSTPEGERVRGMAQDMADRFDNGETISTMENGYLNNAIDEAIVASNEPSEILPEVPEGETIIEPDIVPQDGETPVEDSSTQSQVQDVVNAAVDELIRQQQEDIDTSESTPDEAKKQTETLVNNIQEEDTPEIEFNSKKLEKNSIDNVSQETQYETGENEDTVTDNESTGHIYGEVIDGKISSDALRDKLSHISRFTADNIEYEIANDDGGYRGYMRDTSGDRFGGVITDARSLRYSTDRKESWQDVIDDLVNAARNNGFTSDAKNVQDTSNDKLRQIAEDNLTTDTKSYDMLSDINSRSNTRFSNDPAAKSVYDEGFREYYNYFETDVASNNPDIVVRTYDENMSKAYELGLQNKSLLTVHGDKAFGNFVLKFGDLTDKMWKAGYNKYIENKSQDGGNQDEEADIDRGSGTGQTESTVLGNEGQVSDRGTIGQSGNDEVREGTTGRYDTVHTEEIREDGEREDSVQSSGDLQRENEGNLYSGNESRDERGSGTRVREGDQVRSDEQRSRIEDVSNETAEEETEQKDEVASQEAPKGNNFVFNDDFNKTIPRTSAKRRDANVAAVKTLAKIIEEDRIATPDEQEILARFTGWGGVDDANFEKAMKSLEGVLTEQALEDAKHEKLAAYYTSPDIIKSMYKGIAGLGFKGGRVLEPSCGVGRFIGCMPDDMLPSVKRWTAVELSEVPGNIARLLYPNADVRVQGFETVNILDNFNDVVIGNVPFGSGNLYGKDYPKFVYSRLENYFIARSLDKTRPGGLCVLITSSTILDNANDSFRNYIKGKADLLGAVRLPDNAFGDTGTDVITDILVFKKRADGMPYEGADFSERTYLRTIGDYVNNYFVNNPSMVLGKFAESSDSRKSYTIQSTSGKLSDKIERAFSMMNGQMEYNERDYELERERREARNTKKGTAYVRDGQLYLNDNGEERLLKDKKSGLTDKKISYYTHAMEIRDTAKELLKAQRDGQSEETIEGLRKTLNDQYDAFYKETQKGDKAGFHKPEIQKLLADDTDYSFLQSLEKVSTEDGKPVIKKAPIFFRNTLNNPVEITHVDTLPDGIEASLGKVGYIDLSVISDLMGKDAAAIEKDLDSGELAFRDANFNFVPANLYLSGNVRAKLKEAKTLAESDKRYEKNVKALEKVQPEFVHGDKIKAHVGSTWIPDAYYSQFISDLMGVGSGNVVVHHVPNAGYSVWASSTALRSAQNKSTWGNDDMNFLYENQDRPGLLWKILNNYNIEVTYTYKDSEGKSHTEHNQKSEAELRQLKSKLNDEFNKWLWKDNERKNNLESVFNDSYNSNIEAHFNDAVTIKGQSPDITLRPHQKRLVNRVAFSPYNTLAQHGVGAGKTFGAIASLMKMKQLGMISKPVIVVPKNKISDWSNDFYKLFPGANLLLADANTFIESKRREFVNRIATNDCDAVIISYEQFKMLPMTPEKRLEYNRRELKKIMETAEQENLKTETKNTKGGDVKTTFKGTNKTTRQLQTLKDRLEKEIKALEGFKKDDTNVFFEETGIDYICLDEAQNYKNLMYYSNLSGVADMGNATGSQRAKDLKIKTDYIRSVNKGKGVLLLTATPIMNSPVEAYTMLRYLAEEELEKKGIRTLDDFISMFGEIEDIVRMDNAGHKWTTKTSFTGFCNIPQWQTLWRTYVDRVKTEDIEGIKLPKRREETIICQAGPKAAEVFKGLPERLKNRTKEGANHIFAIQMDGKKASFTQRFFDETLPYGPEEKVVKTVDEIVKEYNDTKFFKDWDGNTQENGVQLVFCDFGTPKSQAELNKEKEKNSSEEFVADDDNYNPNSIQAEKEQRGKLNIYKDMKDMLVKKGIPASEIAFIQDSKGDVDKQEKLYDDVRKGRVRVLIGSTMTMAEGLNVQDRITCMHLMNPFKRPGDKEQAIGRGIRQFNLNPEVKIKIYVTEGTFDTKEWENTNIKEHFINNIQDGNATDSSVRMEYSDTMSSEDIMAIASGNPLLKTQSKTNDRLRKLNDLKDAYFSKRYRNTSRIQSLTAENERLTELIASIKTDIKNAKDISGENFTAVVGGKRITDRTKFGTEILKLTEKYIEDSKDENKAPRKLGTIAGFDIIADDGVSRGYITLRGEHSVRIEYPTENGQISFDKPSGVATRFQNAIKNFPKELSNAETTIKENRENIEKYKADLDKPFEQQQELEEVTKLSEDIENALKANDDSVYDDLNDRFTELKDEYKFKKSGTKNSVKTKSNTDTVPTPKTSRQQEFEENLHPDEWEADVNNATTITGDVQIDTLLAKVAHDFGFNLTQGSRYLKGSADGTFNMREKGIKIKKANDLPAFAHELGHWLADKNGVIGANLTDAAKADAIKAFNRELSQQDYKKEEMLDEGIAQFTSYYCRNRDTAMIDYPDLADQFMKALTQKELADFNAFADGMNAILARGLTEVTQKSVNYEDRNPDLRTAREKINDKMNRLRFEWIDKNHALRLLDQKYGTNIYTYATNNAYADARVQFAMDDAVYDYEGNYVCPGLARRLQGLNMKNKKELEDFNNYLIVRHAPERLKLGKRTYADDRQNNERWLKERRQEYEDKYPNFKKIADGLYEYQNAIYFNYGVKCGLVPMEVFKASKKDYPSYVPLHRAGFKDAADSTKRAKGSGRTVINPLDSIIINTNKIMRAGMRNQIMLKLRSAAINEGIDAMFMEKIPTPKIPVKFDMRGIKQSIINEQTFVLQNNNIDPDLIDVLQDTIDEIDDTMIQFTQGFANGRRNEIAIKVGADTEFWKINDPLLFDTITSMDYENTSRFFNFYGKTTSFIAKMLTGTNVKWSVFSNAPRDLQTFYMFTDDKNPLHVAGNILDSWKNSFNYARDGVVDDFYREFKALGANGSAVWSGNSDSYVKKMRAKLRGGFNPLEAFMFLSDTIEQGPRYATYKICRERGMSPQESYYASMDITTDFRRHGVRGKELNKIVLFSNAAIQGVDKMIRYYTAEDLKGKFKNLSQGEADRRRGKAILGRLAFMLASQLGIAITTYLLNHRTDKLKKEFNRLSNYVKNQNIIIPINEEGKYFAIPKGRENMAPASFFERVLERTLDGNEDAFREYFDYAADQLTPPVVQDLVKLPVVAGREGLGNALKKGTIGAISSAGLFGVITQEIANMNYLGNPIVYNSYQKSDLTTEYDQKTSELAYLLGQATGLSPKRIDHFAENTLGWIWDTQKALFPINENGTVGKRDLTLGVKNTYIKDNLRSNDITNWIYDKAEESEIRWNTRQDNMMENALDQNMKSYYATFNKASKTEEDTADTRALRRQVLDELIDYKKGEVPVNDKIYDLVERTGETKYLPTVQNASIKNGDGEVRLNGTQYVEYQKSFEDYYDKFSKESLDPKEDMNKQEKVADVAEKTAKQLAMDEMLKKMGIEPSFSKDKSTKWVEDGGDFDTYIDAVYAFTEIKESMPGKDNTDKRKTEVRREIKSHNLSYDSQIKLWELAGYKASTYSETKKSK